MIGINKLLERTTTCIHDIRTVFVSWVTTRLLVPQHMVDTFYITRVVKFREFGPVLSAFVRRVTL